jgi:CBS domain-containing protein
MTTATHIEKQDAERFARATVADVMTVGIIHCSPETPLRTVARLMAEHRVHAVFVFDFEEADENVEVWGTVSDLDLVASAWADIGSRTAGRSAVTPLVTVTADDPLRHAAQRMTERGVSHLAVLDPDTQRPVGVISTLDIARAIAELH